MTTKRAEFTPQPKGSGFSSDRLMTNNRLDNAAPGLIEAVRETQRKGNTLGQRRFNPPTILNPEFERMTHKRRRYPLEMSRVVNRKSKLRPKKIGEVEEDEEDVISRVIDLYYG